MQVISASLQEQGRGIDVIREAVNDVLHTDVISKESKRSVLTRLAVLKTALDCADNACHGCDNQADCGRLIEGILASN